MKRHPEVSVVVPTFREVDNLSELCRRLFDTFAIADIQAEVIIVDDNSQDGTVELCEKLSEKFPLHLVTRTTERGLATAVICGLRHTIGHIVVVMDADLSHPPESVPQLLNALRNKDADFVIGSRYVDGGSVDDSWSLLRHINSRVATLLAVGLTSAKDPMAGFFALRRSSLLDLSTLRPCGYKIGLELIVKCGCENVAEVPIRFEDRQRGESKLNLKQQWLYVKHLALLYLYRFPDLLRFARFAAVGLSGLAVDLLCFQSLSSAMGIATARALAIWTAMTWNYEWNRRITFSEPFGSHPVAEYLRFCTACLTGAAISWSTSLTLMWSLPVFATRPTLAVLVGTALAAVLNYAVCRMWVFAKRPAHGPAGLKEIVPN